MHEKRDTQKGQALVEFALTLPILLFVILGIIDLARVLFGLTQVIDGARQGVRYGLVEGMSRDTVQWFDCAGIRQQVRDLPGLLQVSDSDIDVFWEDSQGNNLLLSCTDTLTTADFDQGDVLAVRVRGSVQPITPVLSSLVGNVPFSYTARRTLVLGGADYTEEWIEPPAKPLNFAATVECDVTTACPAGGCVDFTWSSMSPVPDRMEIRSGYTGEVIAAMEPPATAYCYNCDTLADGDSDLYYLVAMNGSGDNVVEGPPSSYAFAQCGTASVVTITGGNITGTVFHDIDGLGTQDATDPGIPYLSVYLESAGDNGVWDGLSGDDTFYATSTDSTGSFSFTGLQVPRNQTAGLYRIVIEMDAINTAMSWAYDANDIAGDGVYDNNDITDAVQTYGPTNSAPTYLTAYLGNDDAWNVVLGYTSLDYYNWYIISTAPAP